METKDPYLTVVLNHYVRFPDKKCDNYGLGQHIEEPGDFGHLSETGEALVLLGDYKIDRRAFICNVCGVKTAGIGIPYFGWARE